MPEKKASPFFHWLLRVLYLVRPEAVSVCFEAAGKGPGQAPGENYE